jgi:hypothetical protein
MGVFNADGLHKRMIFSLSSLILLTAAMGVNATPQGVWKGTLGKAAIVACFNKEGAGGSYYYVRYLAPLALYYRAENDRWYEPPQRAYPGKSDKWQLEAPRDGSLHGSWTAADGKRSSPVTLSLVDGSDDPRACARDSYAKALDDALSVVADKRITFGKHAYRVLSFAGSQTMQILDGGHVASGINGRLLSELDRSPEAAAAYIATRRSALGDHGTAGEDELLTEPVYWANGWFQNYRWADGLGRRGISWSYGTWNLATGKPVDPWDWFESSDAAARHRRESGVTPLTTKLRALFFKSESLSPADADNTNCESYDSLGAGYDLTLANDGFHFDQPAYGDGCDHAFVLSYKNALPLMTVAGRQAVSRILEGGEKSAAR